MLKYNKYFRVLILIALVFSIASCVTTGQVISSKAQQEKNATIWIETYESVYKDSMSVMKNPDSTQAQKDIALKQRDILKQVWPLLKAYTAPADPANPSGPMAGVNEDLIIQLMNQLTTLATGGIK